MTVQKHIFTFFILLMLLGGFACNIKEPLLPSWETSFRLPFQVDRILVGKEIIDADSTASITFQNYDGQDSVLFFSLADTAELEEFSAADLSLAPDNTSRSAELGTLSISLGPLETPNITFAELTAGLVDSTQIGQSVTVPAITILDQETDLESSEFQQLHITQGIIRLTVTNDLPMTLGPDLVVKVVNLDPNFPEEFDLTFTAPIAPGASASAEANIDNQWLVSPFRFQYTVPVQATTINPLTSSIYFNSGFKVGIEFIDIEADEVIARLDGQDFDEEVRIGYDDENRLRSAIIDGGAILIDLDNTLPVGTNVTIKVPAVTSAAQDTFTQTVNVPANSTSQVSLDFNGNEHEIRDPDNPGALIDSLTLLFEGQTFDTGNQLVSIRSTDQVNIAITSDSLFLRSFSGFIAADTVEIESFSEDTDIDYGNFDGDISLSNAILRLNILSDVQIENLVANITVKAYREENGSVTDSATVAINEPVFSGGNATEVVVEGPEMANLLSILPTSFTFSGEVILSGDATLNRGDKINADYRIDTPLKVQLNTATSFESDPEFIDEDDISDILADAAEDNILSGQLTFLLNNHIPVGGRVTFVITRDIDDQNLFDPPQDTSQVIIKSIDVAAAPSDPVSGFVSGVESSEIVIPLNRREIQLFKQTPLKFAYQLTLNGTNGFITLRYSDYVEMIGAVDFRILIEDEDQ